MRPTDTPASVNPLVGALLNGTAPRALRISAARGVLPLMRGELLRILVVLMRDGDEAVRAEATARLAAFTEEELRPLLEDPAAPAEILDHFGSNPDCPAALREMLLANPATPGETLHRMIPSLSAAQVDLVLLNQTRLIADPGLLDALESGGPPLTPLQRSRVDEIRRHFLRAPAPAATTPAPDAPGPAVLAPPVETRPAPAAAPPPGAGTAPAAPQAEEGAAEPAVDLDTLIANATQRIMRLNTAEKIQLAFRGTREERSILIKDSSKLVQEAVLESPKLTENEVEGIAKMRSVGEDVLRIIAANREWTKSYSIAHSLAQNPKTPVGIAINLVGRLTNHDLKLLGIDKNVTEVVRRQARKILDGRNQGAVRH